MQLKSLVALPPSEENIINIKQLLESISLKDLWDIDALMQKEIQQVSRLKKGNEKKVLTFLKEVISALKSEIESKIEALANENKALAETNLKLTEEVEDLEEQREEMEKIPTTTALAKNESPFRRFIRIMTEKSDLWTEVEVEDKIVLRNSVGEIRGAIPKESDESKAAIIKTEKEIIKKKKKYNIFQRLKNLGKSEVFTMEPDIREDKLNRIFLEIAVRKGEIEDNIKKIEANSKNIDQIYSEYDKFVEQVTKIIEEGKEKDSLQVAVEMIDEIIALNNLIKGKSSQHERSSQRESLVDRLSEGLDR